MQRGIYWIVPGRITGAQQFLGYNLVLQCSAVVVLVIFFLLLTVAIVIPVVFQKQIGEPIWEYLKATAATLAISWFGRRILSCIQIRRGRPDNIRLWSCLEVPFLLLAAFVGPWVAGMRCGIMMLFNCIALLRMDISLLPPGFKTFDFPAMAFYRWEGVMMMMMMMCGGGN